VGIPAGEGEGPHPTLETAIEWVLETTQKRFEELNTQVEAATIARKKEEAARKSSRERKVLRNKIAAAFPSQANPTLLPLGVTPESKPDECLTEEEGLAFLAGEIGSEAKDLPANAVSICLLVGYQRLALQIIGGLHCPISKKKDPMSWDDLLILVKDIRIELNLD
jgi:hypothetical protein